MINAWTQQSIRYTGKKRGRPRKEEKDNPTCKGDLVSEIWITKDGREVPVKDMPTRHLQNCVKYVIAKEDGAWRDKDQWLKILMKELSNRL